MMKYDVYNHDVCNNDDNEVINFHLLHQFFSSVQLWFADNTNLMIK